MNEQITFNLKAIETERLILRKLTLDDAKDVYEYASDKIITKYVTWYPHKSLDESVDFIKRHLDKYKLNEVTNWGIHHKADNKIIGSAGYMTCDFHSKKAELGYALSRNYWNQGIMTEVIKEAISFGFNTLRLIRIQALCKIENIASSRVMEKSGMEFEGILKKYHFAKNDHHDMKIYAITK